MTINIFDTETEVLSELTSFFIKSAENAINERGEFNVALSGGNSPKKFYQILASADIRGMIDWQKINFFFGDERYVPADDPENNASMVKKILFDPLNISPLNIFPVDTSFSPHKAAKEYASTITKHFKGQEARFDLILLGLGGDAHTASLFPHTPVLNDQSASVKAVFLEQQNTYRITMTAPLINHARNIAFLVYGPEKAEAVRHSLEDESDPERYPAQLINPEDSDLQWFLDKTAASGLAGTVNTDFK